MRNRCAGILAVLVVSCTAMAAERYVWPPLPSEEELKRALEETTYSGLVILKKDCALDYSANRSGVRRETFLRYAVANEEGAGRASILIEAEQGAKIEVLEARTVARDGTVTPAHPGKDVHTVEMKRLNDSEVLASIATVNFPAPAVGAILDLHFVASTEIAPRYHQEALAKEGTPSLETRYRVRPAYMWSTMLLNAAGVGGKLTKEDPDWLVVRMGPVPAKKAEFASLPSFRTQPVLVLFHSYTPADRLRKIPKGTASSTYTSDAMGRITDLDWGATPYREAWVDFLKDEEKACKEFLKRDGQADEIQVQSVAPRDLPVEERVRRLYRCAQEHLRFAPDAERISTLGDVVRRGETHPWQGTLFLSYLLEKAAIPCKRVMIVDRSRISFSPVVTSNQIFNLADAVMVDLPAGPLFMMAGDLELPFGCLAEDHQYSLAFALEGETGIRTYYTPLNAPGVDTATFTYRATISPSGSLQGEVTLAQRGEPGLGLRKICAYRNYRKQHPVRRIDKVLTDRDWTEFLEKSMKEEMARLGTKVQFEKHTLGPIPSTSEEPLEIRATLKGEGLAQPMQDRWVIQTCPLIAGFSSPFTEPQRRTPIWNEDGGRVTYDGTIRLPAGAKVLEVPLPEEFTGPGGAKVTLAVEVGQEGDEAVIHSRLAFDMPLIVGSDAYRALQVYLNKVAALADSKCIATLPPTAEPE